MIPVQMTNLWFLLIFTPGCFWYLFSSPHFFSPIVYVWQLFYLLFSLGLHSDWLQEIKGNKSDSMSPSSLPHFIVFLTGTLLHRNSRENC